MTEFETSVVARLAALEHLQISAIGLLFAMTGNDPHLEKMKMILDELQRLGQDAWDHLPAPVEKEAKAVLSDLIRRVAEAAVGHRGATRAPH